MMIVLLLALCLLLLATPFNAYAV